VRRRLVRLHLLLLSLIALALAEEIKREFAFSLQSQRFHFTAQSDYFISGLYGCIGRVREQPDAVVLEVLVAIAVNLHARGAAPGSQWPWNRRYALAFQAGDFLHRNPSMAPAGGFRVHESGLAKTAHGIGTHVQSAGGFGRGKKKRVHAQTVLFSKRKSNNSSLWPTVSGMVYVGFNPPARASQNVYIASARRIEPCGAANRATRTTGTRR
jgi:hypothetical protein